MICQKYLLPKFLWKIFFTVHFLKNNSKKVPYWWTTFKTYVFLEVCFKGFLLFVYSHFILVWFDFLLSISSKLLRNQIKLHNFITTVTGKTWNAYHQQTSIDLYMYISFGWYLLHGKKRNEKKVNIHCK